MRPNYRITADDKDITAALAEFRTRIDIVDEAGMKADRLTLEIADPRQRLALPKAGAVLRLELGYDERFLSHMGAWTVDEVEVSGPPDVIRVTARAADMSTEIRSPRTRSWSKVTLGDIVRTIAGEHRLTPKIAEKFVLDLIDHVDQTHESDLHFLTRLATERDAIAKPANEILLFVERALGLSASGKALATISITPDMVSRWRFTFPKRVEAKAVTAQYLDVQSDEPHRSLTVGSGSPATELTTIYPNEKLAREAAQAKYKGSHEKGGQLRLTLPGNPLYRAESPIELSGFRTGVLTSWVAQRVTHRIDDSGYVTEIEGVLPGNLENKDSKQSATSTSNNSTVDVYTE